MSKRRKPECGCRPEGAGRCPYCGGRLVVPERRECPGQLVLFGDCHGQLALFTGDDDEPERDEVVA